MTMYWYTKEHENSIRRVEGSICLSMVYEKKEAKNAQKRGILFHCPFLDLGLHKAVSSC